MTDIHPSTTVRNDVSAVSDGQSTGCIVYWSLSGRVPATELLTALEDMADIPPESGPKLAGEREMLARAVKIVAGRRREVLLDSCRGDFQLVYREEPDGGASTPVYSGKLRVHLGDDGEVVYSDSAHPLCAEISNEYSARRGCFDTREISVWLTELLDKSHAVRMRPRGGFYYLPGARVLQFRAAVMALRACSEHVVYEIPAMSSRETAEAIISALRHEVEAATQRAQELMEGSPGKRARRTHLAELVKVKIKLGAYAEFMDGTLDGVITALDNASAVVSQTLLEGE
ncbi:MAG: hypothetical protein COA94_06100 [Rickettsiales bacterium]|nr:MAG: hypothetical protein COA94_06100 [Rickettsiales bacterium]